MFRLKDSVGAGALTRTVGGRRSRVQSRPERARETPVAPSAAHWALTDARRFEMTDVRRTGPPHRLQDRTRIGIPIEGEVDRIWQRAMQAEILGKVHEQPDLTGIDFFGRSLTINPDEIKFFFSAGADLLPRYLDMIEAAIPRANEAARLERERLRATSDEAEHEVHDRDEQMEQEMSSWAKQRPVVDAAQASTEKVLT
jgi:hypothetical protein